MRKQRKMNRMMRLNKSHDIRVLVNAHGLGQLARLVQPHMVGINVDSRLGRICASFYYFFLRPSHICLLLLVVSTTCKYNREVYSAPEPPTRSGV